MSWASFKLKFVDFFATSGIDILKGLVLFLAGYLLIKLALKITNRVLTKGKVEKGIRKFLYNVVKYVLYFLLIMIILSSFNVSITGLIAILSAVGLALSLALQNSLSNLANGVILIISKPFKQGDVVKIGNIDGVVSEIGMTHTVLTSFENKQIRVPNKLIVESVVENSSVLENRKINFNFLVSYKSDVDKVKDIILKVFSGTNYVLTDPKPFVAMGGLEERGIKIVASCYCEAKYYTQTYHPVLEEIFNEFKKHNIILPYAQLEVRLKEEKEAWPVSKASKLLQKPVQFTENKTNNKNEKNVNDEVKPVKEKTEKINQDFTKTEKQEYMDYLDEVNIIEEIEIDEDDDTVKQFNLTDEDEVIEVEEKIKKQPKQSMFDRFKPKEKDKKQKVVIKKKK